jgi:lysophospholipase
MSPAAVSTDLPPVNAGLPESRVLIIGTGGTICMQEGPDGLAPSDGFLESAMAPRTVFNDNSEPSGEYLASLYHNKTYTISHEVSNTHS